MSTPSPNLGMPIPTVGGDAGPAFAQFINQSLLILDSALGGGGAVPINVAGSSNVTITATQAQNLILQFTGALTRNIIVFLPAVGSIHAVENFTSGAFTLSLACVGSSNTLLVPQNLSMIVYTDGFSVRVSQFTSATGPIVGTTGTFSGAITAAAAAFAGSITGSSVTTTGTGTFSNVNTPSITTPGTVLGINSAGVVIPFTAFTALDLNQSGVGNGNGIVVNIATAASGFAVWQFGGTTVGSVTQSGGQTFYNTTSDQRLKTDQGDITGFHSGRIIDKIKAKWFCWKDAADDDRAEPGFFAQQVYRLFPWAVTKGKSSPGKPGFTPWQMDASKLMPIVIAELQALRQRVRDLERRA